MSWKIGQLVWIESDPSLGAARIVAVGLDHFTVRSLEGGEMRNYTRRAPPFRRVAFRPGQRVRFEGLSLDVSLSRVEIRDGLAVFETERGNFGEEKLVALAGGLEAGELLLQGKFSPFRDFVLLRASLELLSLRRAHPLRGAAGCRVQLLPHQVWVLGECLKKTRVRALLADEVGLGKTIEAGLVFSALHAREGLGKVLVLVPAALKVQWLTEAFRRFNVRFRLDHEELIDGDAFRDFIIASMDEFEGNVGDLDLLIVDEAHRLIHDDRRAGDLEKLVARSKHALFLSATPRVHGDAEFERMMRILASAPDGDVPVPDAFRSRRAELGYPALRQLEASWVPDKEAWILGFLQDWLAQAPRRKLFLIASRAEWVTALWKKLRKKFGEKFALFHEEMTLVERDRQAAYFADPEGAQVLLASEIGGEGRNFQFCRDMLLADLPSDPLVVEQRIGRLDRLGQSGKVRIWVPVQQDSEEEKIFELLRDRFRVFDEAWSGSGLADLGARELSEQAGALSQSLPTPDSSTPFRAPAYRPDEAVERGKEMESLTRIDVREVLGRIYDLYGVEVEDFDAHGNWKVSTSSLMFVDYFPGLGRDGQRVICFDRSQALAREDMSFFSIDHPDVIESLEFFVNSGRGRVGLARSPGVAAGDFLLHGLSSGEQGFGETTWSFATKRQTSSSDFEELLREAEPVEADDLPEELLALFSQAFDAFARTCQGSWQAVLILLPT